MCFEFFGSGAQLSGHTYSISYELTFKMSISSIFNEIASMESDRIQRFVHDHSSTELDSDTAQQPIRLITYGKFMEEHGEKGLKTLTSLSSAQFSEVFDVCIECMSRIVRGRKKITDERTRLLITLVWLHSGLKYSKIGTVFKTNTQNIQRIVTDTVTIIAEPLVAYFLPKTAQRQPTDKKFAHFPDAVGACDVALLFVNKPKGEVQKEWYSAKHKAHGLKLQAIVNPDGICIHYDLSQTGHVHDKKVFDVSSALNFVTVRKVMPNRSTTTTYLPLLFDKGYTGVNHYYPSAIVTQKKPVGGELDDEGRQFNHDVESDRVIVENYFGRMRIKWGILAAKFRSDRKLLPDVAKVCISLTNQSIRDSPLRASSQNQSSQSDSSDSEEE